FRRAPITSLAPGSRGAVIRGGRDHMNLGFMISIPGQPDATPSSLAIWLATRAKCQGGPSPCASSCERRHRSLARRHAALLRLAAGLCQSRISKGRKERSASAIRERICSALAIVDDESLDGHG